MYLGSFIGRLWKVAFLIAFVDHIPSLFLPVESAAPCIVVVVVCQLIKMISSPHAVLPQRFGFFVMVNLFYYEE